MSREQAAKAITKKIIANEIKNSLDSNDSVEKIKSRIEKVVDIKFNETETASIENSLLMGGRDLGDVVQKIVEERDVTAPITDKIFELTTEEQAQEYLAELDVEHNLDSEDISVIEEVSEDGVENTLEERIELYNELLKEARWAEANDVLNELKAEMLEIVKKERTERKDVSYKMRNFFRRC